MKKNSVITWGIIFAVLIIAIVVLNKPAPETSIEVAQCIGENSILYIQLGCHACESQEDLFGDSYQYLSVIDCFFEKEECEAIQKTPTWDINGELYPGIQSIEDLQTLTGC